MKEYEKELRNRLMAAQLFLKDLLAGNNLSKELRSHIQIMYDRNKKTLNK